MPKKRHSYPARDILIDILAKWPRSTRGTSPRPWGVGYGFISSADDKLMTLTDENCKLIVRAVNSHDVLVDTLKRLDARGDLGTFDHARIGVALRLAGLSKGTGQWINPDEEKIPS